MKKIKYLVLLMGVLLLTGCGKEKSNILKVDFEGNATTGYSWRYEIKDPSIIENTKSEYVPDETKENIVGSGGKHYFEFKGLKKGKTKIVFSYARSWEEIGIDAKGWTYEIEVDKNLNVEVVNKEEWVSE